jgi:hypothetical protein
MVSKSPQPTTKLRIPENDYASATELFGRLSKRRDGTFIAQAKLKSATGVSWKIE